MVTVHGARCSTVIARLVPGRPGFDEFSPFGRSLWWCAPGSHVEPRSGVVAKVGWSIQLPLAISLVEKLPLRSRPLDVDMLQLLQTSLVSVEPRKIIISLRLSNMLLVILISNLPLLVNSVMLENCAFQVNLVLARKDARQRAEDSIGLTGNWADKL